MKTVEPDCWVGNGMNVCAAVGGPIYRGDVPERVELWWERRQWSKGATVPYPVGSFRAEWDRYPVLVRQYHPDLNAGIALTQVPPAADVWLQWQCDSGHRFVATPDEQRQRPGRSRRRSTWCPECVVLATGRPARKKEPKRRPVCERTPNIEPGTPFLSGCAPKPASAAEEILRQKLAKRLQFEPAFNAVRLRQPFFEHLEAWPDIVLSDLRVVIEYDTTGREGLEHVGRREDSDRRKDRLLRQVGWEVIRVRCGKLRPLGPHDVRASGVNKKLVERVIDELRLIRGDLIVACYLR